MCVCVCVCIRLPHCLIMSNNKIGKMSEREWSDDVHFSISIIPLWNPLGATTKIHGLIPFPYGASYTMFLVENIAFDQK